MRSGRPQSGRLVECRVDSWRIHQIQFLGWTLSIARMHLG